MKRENYTWKDTNIYPFSIQYSYPLSVRNRCLLFWASTLKGWRAVLNLADKLTEPNRMCVVYLFGEEKRETIIKHISKMNNEKLVVLWADYIPKEEMQVVDAAVEEIRKAKKWAFRKDDEIDDRNPFLNECLEDRFNPALGSQKEIIDKIKDGRMQNTAIMESILRNGYKNLSENMKEVRANELGHLQDLMKVIRNRYPYGAESDTQEEYAYKMVHFGKWCNAGIEGNTDKLEKLGVSYADEKSEFVQLSLFDNTSWGIVEFIKMFRSICDSEIEKNGFVDLLMVFRHMKSPPFGMYQCNYYGLCIGAALNKYSKDYLFSGYLQTMRMEDVDLAAMVKFTIENENMKHIASPLIYRQSEKQIKLVEKLLDIFDIKQNIGVVCMQSALLYMRGWFEKNVRYDTVQRLVPELFEILDLWEPCVCSNATERYADWLTDEKVKQVKKDVRNIDNHFLEILTEKYGVEMSALYQKSRFIKGGAIGWLHSVKLVDERVENYMKKETVCRECGAIIHSTGYQVYNEKASINSVKYENLTKQNIINLNKKMLGRYQNEYFCLKCLCEVLDTDEWSLYEKMLAFKEQGCELF